MPRGKRLTEREIGKIEALEKEGKSQRGIARQLERSLACIQHFLKNRENYGKVKRAGRKKKLTTRAERRILNAASNSSKSCNAIKRELNLDVSKTTIWRTIKKSSHIIRSKMQMKPRLKPEHKEKRLLFGEKHMNFDWNKVFYTI